jgi:hypothetical protein
MSRDKERGMEKERERERGREGEAVFCFGGFCSWSVGPAALRLIARWHIMVVEETLS